ncbi:optic atrophy 3 protein-domain-containing protein [Myxozyma melibiosi]|uniref:Optic atrophy 3 protein-domain-containing protein n=1 Tax=Myxozyma melibiosi TaxID=54550 RepID=A0ABR1F161_9ASCO
MSTIALKIGTLLIRTIAKPIANGVKSRAKVSGPFRKTCIAVAQVLHSTDVRLRQSLMGKAGTQKVRPLNDAKAIEMGANFLSETLLFAVAAGVVIFESVRSSRKATTRHETTAEDIALLKEEVAQLRAIISKLSPDDSSAMKISEYSSSSSTSTSDNDPSTTSATSPYSSPYESSTPAQSTPSVHKFPGIRYDTQNNYIIIPAHGPSTPSSSTGEEQRPHKNYIMTSNSLVARMEDLSPDPSASGIVRKASVGGSSLTKRSHNSCRL